MNDRFTIDGSAALEQRLAELCAKARSELEAAISPSKLDALLLGGGYGRGEGGVLKTSGGDLPYNDLEFYLFLKGPPRWNQTLYDKRLHRIAEQLTAEAGLEVEFKLISFEQLRSSPVSMFYYDLVMGHRWIKGREEWLAHCEHHRMADRIPLCEATRLLMNRCTGLLFSKERLHRAHFTGKEADFTGRNLAKAQLGFGDVFLAAHGQYHWSCRTRGERLCSWNAATDFPRLADLREHHREGVEFKLHPTKGAAPREHYWERFCGLSELGLQLWLWLERRRLEVEFSSARHYALHPINKCPEKSRWRNRLIQAKHFGLATLFRRRSERYPREKLLNTLPLLLWDADALTDPVPLGHVQNNLGTDAKQLADMTRAYESIWSRFN
jgi:hypothetical protein